MYYTGYKTWNLWASLWNAGAFFPVAHVPSPRPHLLHLHLPQQSNTKHRWYNHDKGTYHHIFFFSQFLFISYPLIYYFSHYYFQIQHKYWYVWCVRKLKLLYAKGFCLFSICVCVCVNVCHLLIELDIQLHSLLVICSLSNLHRTNNTRFASGTKQSLQYFCRSRMYMTSFLFEFDSNANIIRIIWLRLSVWI